MLGYQVLVMHEGRVLQVGTPTEVYDAPKNTIVAQVVNDPPMTILSGQVRGDEIVLRSGKTLRTPAHLKDLGDGEYSFGIRASDLVPVALGAGSESCTIEFVEVTGSETVLYATSGAEELVAQVQGIHDYSIGIEVDLQIRTEQLFAFEANGDLLAAPKSGVAHG